MNNPSKCNMAYHRYCRKASLGYCNANEVELEHCPYLNAIGEIARLAAEQVINENNDTNLSK